LLIDDSGHVAGLQIETDPKARLYVRKKALPFGEINRFISAIANFTASGNAEEAQRVKMRFMKRCSMSSGITSSTPT
jgi:hypothetical protein